MSKKEFADFLPVFFFLLLGFVAMLVFIISNAIRIKHRGGLKGKDKLKISIFARIALVIIGFLFLFLFDWKLGVSGLMFGVALWINIEWKDYGK